MRTDTAGDGRTLGRVAKAWSWLRHRLHNRPDREHEVIFNRVLLSQVIFLYLLVAWRFDVLSGEMLNYYVMHFIVFEVVALAMLAHLLIYPGVCVPRRLVGMPFDILNCSWILYVGGETTAMLYPIYLWAIFGNGFRFGVRYLFAATTLAVVSFALVITQTAFWQSHLPLGIGLLLGLIILPLYVSALIRQLSLAKRIAEEASKSKSMFLASVSHELRTPLNAIIALSDLLTDGRLAPEELEMSHTIGRSGRSLLALINSLLDVSRMEIGKQAAAQEEIDLHEHLASVRNMLAVQAETKGIRMALHFSPETPQRVSIAVRHLEEVLVNLAGNAVKFTDAGFVLIHVGMNPDAGRGATLRFDVHDSGIGIAPENLDKIFGQFTQADETIIDRYGGTGLGLSIAKQIVEAHGGRIGVESTPGQGSLFWFEFPCEVLPAGSIAPGPLLLVGCPTQIMQLAGECGFDVVTLPDLETARDHLSALGRQARRHVVMVGQDLATSATAAQVLDIWPQRHGLMVLKRDEAWSPSLVQMSRFRSVSKLPGSVVEFETLLRIGFAGEVGGETAVVPEQVFRLDILVAEDHATNQLVIRKILERARHKVTIVENGQEALDRLAAQQFDIAFMDINMPVLNGIEAARRYRASVPAEERVPMVALTADVTVTTRERCEEAGMIACIGKPIEPQRLLAWLNDFAAAHGTPHAPALSDAARLDDLSSTGHAPAIDVSALRELEQLGGADFLHELSGQFISDGSNLIGKLQDAVERVDAEQFREEVHALRSCAANIGANGIYRMCLEWRGITQADLSATGDDKLKLLSAEFERACCELRSDPEARDAAA